MNDTMRVALAKGIINHVYECAAPDGEDAYAILMLCVEYVLNFGEEKDDA